MEEYKENFIRFALANGLKIFDNPSDDRVLKSKRLSPWFLNVGDFDDGNTLSALSEAYADEIIASGVNADLLYGIPEKGVPLVGPVLTDLSKKGKNMAYFITRKMPKEHGEATGKSDLIKQIVGRVPKDEQSVIQLDDVFTAGDAKYLARKDLQALGNFKLPLLAIALDRQEVGIDGQNAIAKYEKETGTKVVSVVNATDVLNYLKKGYEKNKEILRNSGKVFMDEQQLSRAIERLSTYLRVYGTDEARKQFGKLEQKIIAQDKSVIPACDISNLDAFEKLVKDTADIPGIGGYKIGFELGLTHSLGKIVETARKYTNKTLIYDHQKAGTDIPDTGRNFAEVMKKAGVDAVILFPQAGPETERAWIYHALDNGLKVIVGGRMTHPAYAVSEGGFITDEGAEEMYKIAARAGVQDFVVPGNKIEVIKKIKDIVMAEGVTPIFYSPGFAAQGGKIPDAVQVAGDNYHAIVGRAILQAQNYKEAAEKQAKDLNL